MATVTFESSCSTNDKPAGLPPTFLPPVSAYDRWAEVYDHDANFMTAFDTLQLVTLLPDFLRLVARSTKNRTASIVDLGCGTGRNILKLLSVPKATIWGLDASKNMMEVARERCQSQLDSLPANSRADGIEFVLFDMLSSQVPSSCAQRMDGIISTLVLEHVPVQAFFKTVTSLLVPDGYLLVTNMHATMGATSQAKFRDPQTGKKTITTSYVQTVEDIVRVAAQCGLCVIGEVRERAVKADEVGILGEQSQKWVGVNCWVGIIFQKSLHTSAASN